MTFPFTYSKATTHAIKNLFTYNHVIIVNLCLCERSKSSPTTLTQKLVHTLNTHGKTRIRVSKLILCDKRTLNKLKTCLISRKVLNLVFEIYFTRHNDASVQTDLTEGNR